MKTWMYAAALGALLGLLGPTVDAQIPRPLDINVVALQDAPPKPAPKPKQKPIAKRGTRVDIDPTVEAELPEKLREQIRILRTGHKVQIKEAAQRLVREGDERLLPLFRGLLDDEENDSMRQAVTMGIIEHFPDVSVDLFLDLIENGSPTQQQSSTFALAWVKDDPRVRPTMVRQLTKENDKLRQAASYALLAYARQVPKVVTENVTNEEPVPIDPEAIERLELLRQTLVDLVETGKPIYVEAERLATTYADHATVARIQKHYVESGDAPKKVRELLAKVFRANRYWLGRPVPVDAENISYTFNAQNLRETDKPPKYVNVSFDNYELEAMRARRVHLDRVVHLEILTDLLFILPHTCKAKIFKQEENEIILDFIVPKKSRVRIGVGNFNWGYFQATVINAGSGRLRIDKETGAILSEEIRSRQGSRLAYVEYSNHEPFRDGGYVPTKITADFPNAAVGRERIPMYIELGYQIVEGKFWTLSDATSMDMTNAEEPDLLAVGSIEEIRILAKTPDDDDDGDAAPEKKADDDKKSDDGDGKGGKKG